MKHLRLHVLVCPCFAPLLSSRRVQRKDLKKHRELHSWYDFAAEPFSVSRKDFFALGKSRWIRAIPLYIVAVCPLSSTGADKTNC